MLYRTNSQSRLVEEAMRRYQLNYHVVGGFSFYERAEIKDMISYLKVIGNPDDSIALQRVINTPARGIGKTTMETIERIALETGTSMWGAIGEVIRQQAAAAAGVGGAEELRRADRGRARHAAGNVSRAGGGDGGCSRQAEARVLRRTRTILQHDHRLLSAGVRSLRRARSTKTRQSSRPSRFRGRRLPATALTRLARLDEERVEGFRAPGDPASTAELLKFLIDRTGYIKQLEQEDTPESLARIENLRELVNAAMDSRDRGETLSEFLDHAALVSDADQYDENSRITLMTLHAAKGLEFPLVFLIGLEEGLFPHSRTLLAPDDIEEERRLCYVGMTRAMDTLILTRARYRRRYGTDMPEASVPSRFLEEVPEELLQDLGSPRADRAAADSSDYGSSRHYAYEDEDQRPQYGRRKQPQRNPTAGRPTTPSTTSRSSLPRAARSFRGPRSRCRQPTGRTGFRPGQRVRHPKYGEGTVYKREGDGEDAKITVQFPRFGLKKLVEKYAQLEKA